jgi:hypothetical protein
MQQITNQPYCKRGLTAVKNIITDLIEFQGKSRETESEEPFPVFHMAAIAVSRNTETSNVVHVKQRDNSQAILVAIIH